MLIENICTRKEYEQNGEKKVIWLKCGVLKTTDKGKRFIELNHMPNTTFFVFENKPKEEEALF